MKTFSKPASYIIAFLLFVISGLSYLLIRNNDSNPPQTDSSSHTTAMQKKSDASGTHPISLYNAGLARRAYDISDWPSRIKTDGHTGIITSLNFHADPLKGWRLQLDKITPLLEKWKNGQLSELFIVPVMKPITDTRSNTTYISTEYISLIITGIYNNNIIYDETPGKETLIYEYLKPCPNNCPINYDAIFERESKTQKQVNTQ